MSRTGTYRLRCVICDTDKGVERNHAGGRNHVAWFTMPFCRKHHDQFHALVAAAGIDLEYHPDPHERLLRALKAIQVCEFMLLEAMQELSSRGPNVGGHPDLKERISEHV
jgi:hypothetical protein